MGLIAVSVYDEELRQLKLETSIFSKIENRQYITLLEGDVNMAQRFESQFDSKFQSLPNPIYNCHGMTFASRRTGIYNMSDLFNILSDEYTQVKSHREVLTGDIIVYFTADEKEILHSGIVTFVDNYNAIKILSKAGKLGEIIHHPDRVPEPYKGAIKYYRIGHKIKIRRVA